MTDEATPAPKATPPEQRKISERTRDVIDEAVRQGLFDNLPGAGRPLDLSDEDNPFVPDDLRVAYRLLRNAGFALPWMEDRKDIERKRAELERQVDRHLTYLQAAQRNLERIPAYLRPSRRARLQSEHAAFVARFSRAVDALNSRIDTYNLTVPVVSLQVWRVNRQRYLGKLAEALPEPGE